MGGFSTFIGFAFSFAILAGVITSSFLYMVDDISEKVDLSNQNYELIKLTSSSFKIDSLFYENGRLRIFLENDGDTNLLLQRNLNDCIDIFIDGKYISSSDLDYYLDNPLGNYYVIGPGDLGVLDLDLNLNTSINHDIKVVSCYGGTYEYEITPERLNWHNDDYKRRGIFTIINTLGSNVLNTYFPLKLNSSNFDFTKADSSSIKFDLPVSENLVLNLNFDEYTQQLVESSRYSNIAYLGLGTSTEGNDPSSIEGIFFDGLNFDGNDQIRILIDNSLRMDKSMTVSSWVNWNGSGAINQDIFFNGDSANRLSIVNDGGINDNKILFSLNVGGSTRLLYSNTILDSGWHHILGVFNGTSMRLFIDGIEDNELLVSGDITTFISDNFLGSNGIGNYFTGHLDDIQIYNIAFNSDDIYSLFQNRLRFKELNFTTESWNMISESANLSIKLPYIINTENISFDLYYYLNGETFESEEFIPLAPAVPDTIIDLAGTFENKKISLTWSAPNDNGAPITKYVVEYGTVMSGLFDNTINDDDITGIIISGLNNDVEYQFRVYGVNSNGNAANSNIVTLTPTGRFWLVSDITTNLGFDGAANQGITPIALAETLYGIQSSDSSSCIGIRTTMVNYVIAQEYTPIYSSETEIISNIKSQISVDGSTTGIIWRANLYEYNDVGGDVGGIIGTATNTSLISGPDVLDLTFDNIVFNISSGNRLKVVFDATNGGNKNTYLCYGIGTQSYLQFDIS